MKKTILLLILIAGLSASAQKKVDYNKYTNFKYNVYSYDSDHIDTSFINVERVGNVTVIYDPSTPERPVPGLARELTLADYVHDSLTTDLVYDTIVFRSVRGLSRSDIEWTSEPISKTLTRYTCHINSNKLEFVIESASHCINPLPHYGLTQGVLTEYWRNGQLQIQLARWDNNPSSMMLKALTPPYVERVQASQLDSIERSRLIISHRIFDNVQLCWGMNNDSITPDLSEDTLLHFAGGTLALRRIHLPALPRHYQTFVEIHQRSNGDAYDRTGSLFVIPHRRIHTFLEGLNNPKLLPIFTDRSGRTYQGILPTTAYEPIAELVRFFTPFGVGKFNSRSHIDNIGWKEEAYFKQEVSDMAELIQGDVWIGLWIGNYDRGGHLVTVDLKSYPTEQEFHNAGIVNEIVPLFCTTNVLEMAGQNYGRLFLTDSLTTEFEMPFGARSVRLRYLSTGHGGWGGGDEFNPKPNTILIDGKPFYTYTPWREDCACYRDLNPVSGMFFGGMTSSDYSRSGWCPGTATQPVYIDLSSLAPGTHTLSVAIPQGPDMDGSFSSWNVSGALIIERN